ncbi:cholesterol 25-hydroxylase-like protein 2 [Sardina pilchardus]|uniref:cholesterol 25-hydroxylase-like protein 2 n=1 Tax=Sardina pilchardus TaxID=27697 RepID=UPI002E101D2B
MIADCVCWVMYWVLDMTKMSLSLPEESLLQPTWDFIQHHHQTSIRSPLFPVFLSVSTYLLLVALYTTLDLLAPSCPKINQYRIHQERQVVWSNIWRTLCLTTYNHLVFIFPAAVAQWLWRPPIPLPQKAPTLTAFLVGILGCTVVFDFQYYLWHMLHHRIGWLYRTFHAVHHEYNEPFSLVTQYLSGWELFSVGFWTTLNPLLLQCHCLTTWAFMVFNVWVSTEDHCGYAFPWAMHNLVPFGLWGGVLKHDTHHQKPGTNFAPFFSHWDWLGGTACLPSLTMLNNNKKNKGT